MALARRQSCLTAKLAGTLGRRLASTSQSCSCSALKSDRKAICAAHPSRRDAIMLCISPLMQFTLCDARSTQHTQRQARTRTGSATRQTARIWLQGAQLTRCPASMAETETRGARRQRDVLLSVHCRLTASSRSHSGGSRASSHGLAAFTPLVTCRLAPS